MKKAPESDPLEANPFYILGQLEHALNGEAVFPKWRTPAGRLKRARAILAAWKDANAKQNAAGKTYFLGAAP